jgi:hypothetical protein
VSIEAIREIIEIHALVKAPMLKPGQISPERFMLEHGRVFTVTPKTFLGPRGTPKECYSNSAKRSQRSRSPKLTYAEGYVYSFGIPIPHAFVVDDDGNVIDPTLKIDEEAERHYFGLAFDRGYHKVALLKSTYYSLLAHEGQGLRDIVQGRTAGMLSLKHHPEFAP